MHLFSESILLMAVLLFNDSFLQNGSKDGIKMKKGFSQVTYFDNFVANWEKHVNGTDSLVKWL